MSFSLFASLLKSNEHLCFYYSSECFVFLVFKNETCQFCDAILYFFLHQNNVPELQYLRELFQQAQDEKLLRSNVVVSSSSSSVSSSTSGSFQGLQQQLQVISNMLMSGTEDTNPADNLVYCSQGSVSVEAISSSTSAAHHQIPQHIADLLDSAAADALLLPSTKAAPNPLPEGAQVGLRALFTLMFGTLILLLYRVV